MGYAALAIIAAFCLLVVGSIYRLRRVPLVIFPILATMLWIAVGGVFAESYEAGSYRPFLFLAIAAVPLLAGARALGVALPAHRGKVAALGGLAAFSVAFLVLLQLDPAYLKGFGL